MYMRRLIMVKGKVMIDQWGVYKIMIYDMCWRMGMIWNVYLHDFDDLDLWVGGECTSS